MTRRSTMILLVCLLFSPALHAQETLLVIDTVSVSPRLASAETIQQIRSDPDFQYADPAPSRTSFWDYVMYWWDRFMSPVLDSPVMGPLWRMLMWVLAASSVAYVVAKVAGADVRGVLQRTSHEVSSFDVGEGDIRHLDFDQMIARAEDNEQYREAVRLKYLKVLAGLSGLGLIQWQRDKTNRMYVRELTTAELRPSFAAITSKFNDHWYGTAHVTVTEYERARNAFDGFWRDASSAAKRPSPEVSTDHESDPR